MDTVVPWGALKTLVEPHYPRAGKGRPPLGMEKMLRIYLVQQWFELSDPGAEEAIRDSQSIRRFVGIDPQADAVPDETTILRFRRLLEEHRLTAPILSTVGRVLEKERLVLKCGAIVDAAVVPAPRFRKVVSRQTREG
jgi:IS5 family transposase